jgi:hypothetical protein
MSLPIGELMALSITPLEILDSTVVSMSAISSLSRLQYYNCARRYGVGSHRYGGSDRCVKQSLQIIVHLYIRGRHG